MPRENVPDPLVPRTPEPEALEHRARSLAPLGQPVEPTVEVEVLERGQLAVEERLVSEKTDRATRRVDVELTAVGAASPAQRRSSVVFPDPFGPVTSTKPPRGTSRSSPSRTRLSPKRLDSFRARITAPSVVTRARFLEQ